MFCLKWLPFAMYSVNLYLCFGFGAECGGGGIDGKSTCWLILSDARTQNHNELLRESAALISFLLFFCSSKIEYGNFVAEVALDATRMASSASSLFGEVFNLTVNGWMCFDEIYFILIFFCYHWLLHFHWNSSECWTAVYWCPDPTISALARSVRYTIAVWGLRVKPAAILCRRNSHSFKYSYKI